MGLTTERTVLWTDRPYVLAAFRDDGDQLFPAPVVHAPSTTSMDSGKQRDPYGRTLTGWHVAGGLSRANTY